MTVKELIEKLSEYPPDLEVVLPVTSQTMTRYFSLLSIFKLRSGWSSISKEYEQGTGFYTKEDWEDDVKDPYPGDNCLVIDHWS